jgi:hypothetical protein
LTRGVVLAERPLEYVHAARALGQAERWVLARPILPDCLSPLIVQASVNFANAIVIEAGLSFLGNGTPPPTPSWGLMLNEARGFMIGTPHVAIAPGVAISLAVLGWNLLGDRTTRRAGSAAGGVTPAHAHAFLRSRPREALTRLTSGKRTERSQIPFLDAFPRWQRACTSLAASARHVSSRR